jgi:hypothetical protein
MYERLRRQGRAGGIAGMISERKFLFRGRTGLFGHLGFSHESQSSWSGTTTPGVHLCISAKRPRWPRPALGHDYQAWYCCASDCIYSGSRTKDFFAVRRCRELFVLSAFCTHRKLQAGHPSNSLILLLMRAGPLEPHQPHRRLFLAPERMRREGRVPTFQVSAPSLAHNFSIWCSHPFYFQNDSPVTHKEAKWLPAPKRPFNLTTRLYTPCPTR